MAKGLRGLQTMSPEDRVAAARLGGKAQPRHLRAFSRDPALAKAAARLGGLATAAKRKAAKG